MTVPCIEVPVPYLRAIEASTQSGRPVEIARFSQRVNGIPLYQCGRGYFYGGDTLYGCADFRAAIEATSETTRLALKNHLSRDLTLLDLFSVVSPRKWSP